MGGRGGRSGRNRGALAKGRIARLLSRQDPRRVSVVVVDIDPRLCEQLTTLFHGHGGLKVVGAYLHAGHALDEVHNPDVVVVGSELPDASANAFIADAKKAWPEAEVLVYGTGNTLNIALQALASGASGCVLKGGESRRLVDAIFAVRAGYLPLDPPIARMVLAEFRRHWSALEQATLSHREREILAHVAHGLSYKQIGAALFISPHTVHTHMKNIYEKLQANSKKQLLAQAKTMGLL